MDKLKEAAAKLSTASFITGLEYCVQRRKVMTISTGSKQLDELIGGMRIGSLHMFVMICT